MPSVDDQINRAKAAASRDRDAAAALSAIKLIELKRKSPKAAAGHWQDPDLTPEDRQNLFVWLRRLLPHQTQKRTRQPFSMPPIGKMLRRHPVIALCLVTILAVPVSATWNTPRIYMGTLTSDIEVRWQMGNTAVARQMLPQSSQLAFIGRTVDGNLLVRGWLERTGYVTAVVPETVVQFSP